jgi:hypothetical protein
VKWPRELAKHEMVENVEISVLGSMAQGEKVYYRMAPHPLTTSIAGNQ